MKTKKTKPYRSILSNALWSLHCILKDSPALFFLMLFTIPINVFLTYAGIYLPSLVVAEVTNHASPEHAALRIGLFLLLMFAASLIQRFSTQLHSPFLGPYLTKRGLALEKKAMNCLYQTYEKKEIRDLHQRASIATQLWNGVQPISDMPRRSVKLVENILCYCLFGTMISYVSPWIVPILTIAPVINWFCAKKYQQWSYNNRSIRSNLDSKLDYISSAAADFKAGKDIRVYGMVQWFHHIWQDISHQRMVWDKRAAWRYFLSQIANLAVILLRDGAAYALLISMTITGEITVDQFVLYFAAISSFASFVGNIVGEWNGMRESSLALCDYREFLEMPDSDGTGEEEIERHLHTAPEIRFEHVFFRYDGAEEDTLKDVSFTIRPGEKIALVGANGAGKSTLVKLLCGLYIPTEGDIKINGISIGKFARKDYYRLLSPVFQDVKTAFFSLAEIVSGQLAEDTDMDRAEECMRLADLGEKLDSLPLGIHTMLDKQVNEGGIELSGGELQKLMLAKALYKNSPVLILDEPTAALDPIAENRIYLQYNRMTQEKSSLFISHRLASTQFCDRILYLKNGRITEEGTHRELLALGGEYSLLYEIQSCWYREDYVSNRNHITKEKDPFSEMDISSEADASMELLQGGAV